jgi:hypothetical protein
MAQPLITLDDLHAPVLSEIQKGALAFAEANPVVLDAPTVLEAAVAETGLSDFGADDFRPRLDMWLQSIDEDANLTALGRGNLFQMTVRYAATRLLIEDIVKRHPEILDIVIDRPIIVAGLPRSGTTHLLGLLSADPRLRSLPWWEANAPVPTEADAPTADDPNPRWTRSQAGWEGYQGLLPHMKIMHEFSPDHVSEDIELQALDFSSYLIARLCPALARPLSRRGPDRAVLLSEKSDAGADLSERPEPVGHQMPAAYGAIARAARGLPRRDLCHHAPRSGRFDPVGDDNGALCRAGVSQTGACVRAARLLDRPL